MKSPRGSAPRQWASLPRSDASGRVGGQLRRARSGRNAAVRASADLAAALGEERASQAWPPKYVRELASETTKPERALSCRHQANMVVNSGNQSPCFAGISMGGTGLEPVA